MSTPTNKVIHNYTEFIDGMKSVNGQDTDCQLEITGIVYEKPISPNADIYTEIVLTERVKDKPPIKVGGVWIAEQISEERLKENVKLMKTDPKPYYQK